MPLTINTTVAPIAEPITLTQAKSHCRIDGTEQDDVLEGLIAAARGYVEVFTSRQLMRATLCLKLDRFPNYCVPYNCTSALYSCDPYRVTGNIERVNTERPIILPRPPLVSVSSITYVDTNGSTQTLSSSNYRVDADSEPGRITPAYGYSWPSTREQTNAVAITYLAGYASADVIPPGNKQAMLLLIGHWYENREATVVGQVSKDIELAVDSLLWQQRIEVF